MCFTVCLLFPGVGCFLGGVAPTLTMLGITRIVEFGSGGQRRVYDYQPVNDASSLNEFMVACRKNITLWRQVQEAKTLLSIVHRRHDVFP
jgi:hypothetical protein